MPESPAYHPLRRGFPAHFGYRGSARWGLTPSRGAVTPHPPAVIPWGFGLGCPPFGRPYSGGLVLISFPPPTKMFPFGGFPPGTPGCPVSRAPRVIPVAGSPIRRSRVQRQPAPTPGLSQLATAFLGARAEPSTGRRPCYSPQRRGIRFCGFDSVPWFSRPLCSAHHC